MSTERLPDGRIQLNYKYTQEAAKDIDKLNLTIEEMEDTLLRAAKEKGENRDIPNN